MNTITNTDADELGISEIERDGLGNILSMSCEKNGKTYKKTFGRDGEGNQTSVSKWEEQ